MEEHCLTFGPFRLNCANGTLLRDGEPLPVGQRAVRLLKALLQRRGEVLTKTELMDAAWPDATVEEANLHVQIAALRKILGPAPGGDEWIATVPRVGYRFVPDFAFLNGTQVADAGSVSQTVSAPRRSRLGPLEGWRWSAAALAVIAIAFIVGFMAQRSSEAPQAVAAGPNAAIAVLPFDEMSGNPDLAYFGFGVSEDITVMLARVPNLTVVARNSAFQYRGQAVDVRRIGEELGATHVLEGSVRKDEDRLRIVAQLVDARTGRHVWADRFDRTGTDPRALQDEVTQKIVAALAGNVGTLALQQYAEAWGKDHANLQEYDYLLRSLSQIALGTPAATAQAEDIVAEGLARYPNSSLLKSHAAATMVWRFGRGWSDSENPLEDIRRAGEMARDALSDPRGPPMLRLGAHIALAYANIAERRSDQAMTEAEAALALAPYDGRIVYYLTEIPLVAGRPELALEWIERAETFYHPNDPRQQELSSLKAAALLHLGRPEAALEVLDTIRTSDSKVLRTTYKVRTSALVMLDRLDEAKLEVRKLREHDPSWTLAKHRQRYFYWNPETIERSIQALAAAGLPEN